ncbi:phage minor tail L family protein [Escherichia coli p0305293.11]|nr:phage minor tail L family protein [Escherichia coli p0305293.11]
MNFVNGNRADPEQEVISRWRMSSERTEAVVPLCLPPDETDGLFFRAIMLANTCTWTYRGRVRLSVRRRG